MKAPVDGQPAISAIICTRNRSRFLTAALGAMARLDLTGIERFELVVVNNNSSDDTHEVVSRFAGAAPFPVRHVLEKREGVCFAKNAGLASATGNVILMTDDDCLVAPNWVQAAARVFSENPLQLIGGRIELHDKAHLPLSIKTQTTRDVLASAYAVMGFAHGNNLAFGRAVIDRIGKFDVRLGPGRPLLAAEDAEFIYRAYINNIPVIYEPALLVYHDHGRAGLGEWRRMTRAYAVGAGAMMMKHLLRGRIDLARMLYWDLRALIRDRRTGVPQEPWLFAKIAALGGAFRFLVWASWQKSE